MLECCKKTYVEAFKEVVILIEGQLANISPEGLVAALKFAIKEIENEKK
jgi:hypothetical protein